ncbi:hypothetical protein CRG98_010912, partial [Punica granatum]
PRGTSSEILAEVLKLQSLAKALVHYYPLDPEGQFMVDCAKKCVPFVEAIMAAPSICLATSRCLTRTTQRS